LPQTRINNVLMTCTKVLFICTRFIFISFLSIEFFNGKEIMIAELVRGGIRRSCPFFDWQRNAFKTAQK